MRREIEAALDSERNIVPLMLAGFDFGTPATVNQLTGKLAALKQYNGLPIPKGYFSSAMERLRSKFLNVPTDAVLHLASDSAQQVAKEQKDKATVKLGDTLRQQWLSSEEELEVGRKAKEERKRQEVARRRQAEAERERREAEAKRRAEEETRQRAAEEERRKREAEMEQRRKELAEAGRAESVRSGSPTPRLSRAAAAVVFFILLSAGIALWSVSPRPWTPQANPPTQQSTLAKSEPVPAKPEVSVSEPQRALLHEEESSNPQGKQYVGSAVWRTETVLPGSGLAPELQVRADVTIPERNMTVTWKFRRNTDQALPASHTIEIIFNLPPDFPGGGVANVPGVLMKESEPARGVPLAGLAVKVTNGFFLIGLSAVEADEQKNMHLLKDRPWLDIPIVYNNGGRAILAMEKGPPGDRAFADAFAAWDKKSALGSDQHWLGWEANY
jgi:hypothetical protein